MRTKRNLLSGRGLDSGREGTRRNSTLATVTRTRRPDTSIAHYCSNRPLLFQWQGFSQADIRAAL